MSKKERRLEISSKLLQMGQSLVNEGQESGDKSVAYCGTSLILLAGTIIDSKDMQLFSELCSMFSAKKVLEGMMGTPDESINRLKNGDLEDLLRKMSERADDDDDTDKD